MRGVSERWWFCCSVAKLCQTLCNPVDCSPPGSSVSPSPGVCSNPCSLSQWSLSHWVIRWVNPLIISLLLSKAKEEATRFSFSLQSFPASGSFPMSQLFISGGQSIVALALASVLLMNIQGWFPLGLTCLSSLLSKGLWRVFSIAQGYCVIAS